MVQSWNSELISYFGTFVVAIVVIIVGVTVVVAVVAVVADVVVAVVVVVSEFLIHFRRFKRLAINYFSCDEFS